MLSITFFLFVRRQTPVVYTNTNEIINITSLDTFCCKRATLITHTLSCFAKDYMYRERGGEQ